MAKGYVYILTNPCIQYTFREGRTWKTVSPVKIGMAKDVEKRLGTLNTSLPENFVHHMSVFSHDPKALENIVHRILGAYRIDTKHGDRTEFFRCSVSDAVAVLKQTAKDMHLTEYKIDKSKLIGRSSCKIKANKLGACSEKSETWEGKTQLAKLIARRGGNEGAFGGILHLLNAKRPCTAKSKWRKSLELIGVKFDSKGYVRDWTCARKRF
jgi:hypothetical protein